MTPEQQADQLKAIEALAAFIEAAIDKAAEQSEPST
jgi:hypothetical protein